MRKTFSVNHKNREQQSGGNEEHISHNIIIESMDSGAQASVERSIIGDVKAECKIVVNM